MHFAESDGSNRVDIYDAENVSGGGRLTPDSGGGPMFVLHEGEVVKAQTEASSDMEFVVTFDLLGDATITGELRMTPEQLNAWRIIPRLLMFAMICMTYRTVEWFMSLT